jgi:hypothetical protein
MATVRLTNDLQGQIITNAENLFTKRAAEASEGSPLQRPAEFYLDTYLDADPVRRAAYNAMVAAGWVASAQAVRIKFFSHFNSELPIGRKFKVPASWSNTHYANPGLVIEGETDRVAFADLLEQIETRKQRMQAVADEKAKFIEQVKKVMRSCSTLKQALSLWPGLWELVPQSARNQHNEVVVRGPRVEREQETPDVDVDSLNAAVVVAKIVEGAI